MIIKRSILFILLSLVSGVTFAITFFAVGSLTSGIRIRREKQANMSEIASLLDVAESLHNGDYDEAKRKLCNRLLYHAWDIGKLKQHRYFGEREEANRSLVRIGSFYESHGGYLDCYYIVDASRYIEEARTELNE